MHVWDTPVLSTFQRRARTLDLTHLHLHPDVCRNDCHLFGQAVIYCAHVQQAIAGGSNHWSAMSVHTLCWMVPVCGSATVMRMSGRMRCGKAYRPLRSVSPRNTTWRSASPLGRAATHTGNLPLPCGRRSWRGDLVHKRTLDIRVRVWFRTSMCQCRGE